MINVNIYLISALNLMVHSVHNHNQLNFMTLEVIFIINVTYIVKEIGDFICRDS